MNWKKDFRDIILRRGKKIYRLNLYDILEENHDRIRARVYGAEPYHVVNERKANGGYLYSCTCPYAMQGSHCKHEAAVMYAWTDESVKTNDKHNLVPLFTREQNDELYFDIAWIAQNVKIEEGIKEKAVSLIENNEVFMEEPTLDYHRSIYREDERMLDCHLKSNNPNQWVEASISITDHEIKNGICLKCSRAIGYHQYDLCEHLAALLLLADEYVLKENPGDATNVSGDAFLKSYGKAIAFDHSDEVIERKKVVQIEPRIIRQMYADYLELSFRIGVDKMYVLKDFSKLVEAYQNRQSFRLGKNRDIHFLYDDFTEESKQYFEYIVSHTENASYFDYASQRVQFIGQGGVIPLLGYQLDHGYDLFEGKTFSYEDKSFNRENDYRRLTFGDSHYPISINVEGITNEGAPYIEMHIDNPPTVYEGGKHSYVLHQDHLSKMDEKEKAFFQSWPKNRYEGYTAKIGKNAFPEFYYRLLPKIKELPHVTYHENLDNILPLLPEEAQLKIYLDVEEGIISCRAIVNYGEKEYGLVPNFEVSEDRFSRDKTQELRFAKQIQTYFEQYEDGLYYALKNDDFIFYLLSEGMRDLMAIGEVHTTPAFDRLRLHKLPTVKVGVSVLSNLLDLSISSQDYTQEELIEILNSYQKKKRYHRLQNGDFIPLDENETLDSLMELMRTMNVSLEQFVEGKIHLPMYRALYVNKLLEEHDELVENRDKTFRNIIRNFNTIKDSDYTVPEAMKDVLRNYQEYGFKWLNTLSNTNFGGILADDMGLGKTIQIIALLLSEKENGNLSSPALIITPASVVYNWIEEMHRFAPALKAMAITGTLPARKELLNDLSGVDVIVTSYDLLKRDIGLYKDIHFSYEIIDEGQYIKNPSAAVSKAVKVIDSEHRFALTGTPIENRLSELWSIFDYLMPGFLYSYDQFKAWYENPIVKANDELTTNQLKKMVSPFILRRLKEDVLKDLPEKLEEVRYARFDDKQKEVYDGQLVHMQQLLNNLDESSGQSKIIILAELLKMRQICCDPGLLFENYNGESAKREMCLDLVKSAIDGGHKILLFSQFTSMLALLEEDLKKEKIGFYKITGATSKEERMKYVHQFNEDDIPVFLISLKAGGTGLNLVGADVVIHYDPWWNYAAQNQATDRAHRIGQTKKVTVYKLIAKDTIEERVMELQEAKKDLADAILSGEHTSLSSLSKEELLDLISV